MGALTQSFAQSGNSCSTPIALGSLKDTTYSITFNYPDTVKWLSFSSDSSLVSFLAFSNKDTIGFIKFKEVNIYSNSCALVSGNPVLSYPGEMAESIKKISLNTSQTYLIKVSRYYHTSLNDTNNREVYISYRGGGLGNCINDGNCSNMVNDGAFENSIMPLSPSGAELVDLACWYPATPAGGLPVYLHIDYNNASYEVPTQSIFQTGINLNPESPDLNFFPNNNNAYLGLKTNEDNADIAQGYLEADLTPNTQYFASYIVSPGKNYSVGYHDRIDLDVLHYSFLGNYDPAIWDVGYIAKTPAVQSGVVDFSQAWTRVSNVFTSGSTIGESIIYIGNLAQQPYTTPITGAAQSYYVDNVIIKPFELELGPDIMACAGESVNIIVPCQYLYPGAEYKWDSDEPGFQNPGTANLSFIAIGNYWYELTITVTNPQGGIETVTDLINVTIAQPPSIGMQIMGGPQGMYCVDNGILYIVQGNQVNLQGNGAGPNGTYNWYVNGALVTTNQLNFNIPGLNSSLLLNEPYQVTVEGNDGVCAGDTTLIFELVANRCQLPCNLVLGENAFPTGPNASINYTNGAHDFVNTSATNFSSLPIDGLINPGLTYVIDGTFTVNAGAYLDYNDVTFLISPGGKIINNGQINFTRCVVDACEQMWDRIDNNGTIVVLNSNINHAEAAIELRAGSLTKISGSTFTNNILGVFSRDVVNSSTPKILGYFSVVGTTFQGVGIISPLMRFPSLYSQYTGLTGSNPVQQPEFYLRPANGINIVEVNTINIGTSVNNTLPNHFINMWNGITFNNTAGIIDNCRFEGMEANANHGQLSNNPNVNEPQDIILTGANPNYSTHYLNIVTNCISVLNNSTLSLFSLNNDNVNTPTFSSCFRGISVISSNLNTTPITNNDFMFFNNVNTGVRVERLLHNQVADINRLNITCNNLGVVVFPSITLNQQGNIGFFPLNSSRLIHNNIINAVRTLPIYPNPVAIQYREINANLANYSFNNSTPLTACEINNNVINGFGALMGIEIWNARNTIVRDNLINLNASQGVNAQTSYRGVYLLNTFVGEVRCNTINDNSGLAYNIQNDGNAAIWCNSSLTSLVSQNTSANFERGIRMTEFCTGSRLEGNNIGNHNTGLFYDLVTDVGIQNHTGNRWLGSYPDYGARWSGAVGNQTLIDNQYRVDQAANANFLPFTVDPATGWFFNLNSNGTTFIGGACNAGLAPAANNTSENILRLAENNNDSTLYGDEKEYNAKKVLFENLENNDSLIFLSNLLQDKYDSLVYTNIRDIYELNKAIGNIYVGTINQNISLWQLTSTKNDIWNNWLEATKNNDSLAAIDFSTQLQQVNMAIDAISQQIQAAANNKRNTALSLLNSITANNIMEQNMKDVLEIYLNKVFDAYIDDLTDDVSTLASIAFQCPIAGGDAVFIARMLYLYIVPEAEFNDNNICNNDANARQEKKENKTFAFSFNNKTSVYPSPSKGIVHINSSANNISSVIIRDLSGRIVLTPSINPNSINTIDCAVLGNGFYLLEINYENLKSEVFKINILK
jgi:hypothetical protein